MWKHLKTLWHLGDYVYEYERLEEEHEKLRRELSLYRRAFAPLLKEFTDLLADSQVHMELEEWVKERINCDGNQKL